MSKKFLVRINLFLISLLLVANVGHASSNSCLDIFSAKKSVGIVSEVRDDVSLAMLDFAKKQNLPFRIESFGPEEFRRTRLLVALDINNPAILKAYREAFYLEAPLGAYKGALVLEFSSETPQNNEHYVTGVLRRYSEEDKPIYRWNREDLSLEDWWKSWFLSHAAPVKSSGILGFSHIIGLNEAQLLNVKKFLDPESAAERGPCKSDNCVAWIANIELGNTHKEASTQEREPLFNYLGMSRAMAHFEIGRRLLHAANENHTGIFVFVDGDVGLAAFKGDLSKVIPPNPKIPYFNIISGLGTRQEVKDALKIINENDKVFFPIAAGASPEAMQGLAGLAQKMEEGVEVHVLVNGISERVYLDALAPGDNKFRIKALFLGGNLRRLYSEGKVDVVPGNLGDFTRLMQRPEEQDFNYDAIVVRVSPPDAQGRMSLGPNNDMILTILRHRPNIKVIAEINPNIPHTLGANFLLREQIHSSFQSNTELSGPAVVPLTETEINIGQHLATIIDSGATLQVGIGNIFAGLPEGLRNNRVTDIKIVTEMFGDPLKEIIDAGIAVSAETGFVYGSKDLYAWLENNPKIAVVETEQVNDLVRIVSTPKFHAVNTALQVSLHGEVNATMGPNGRISSPGGQVEFMSGASKSINGKAIIAIRSTAKEGTISSIVLELYKGPITTPHEAVTHVVTEYGVAVLQGKTEVQRAIALINVAHPQFRQTLFEGAIEKGILRESHSDQIQRN